MQDKTISPLRAIRLKCLDCCCQQRNEVKDCTAANCPLFNFRLGKNPNRKSSGRVMTDEQKQAVALRLKQARESKKKE